MGFHAGVRTFVSVQSGEVWESLVALVTEVAFQYGGLVFIFRTVGSSVGYFYRELDICLVVAIF